MIRFLSTWRERGKSLILASHILHEVEAVDPSFLLISGGRLLASGSPEHVREILMDTPNSIRIRSNEARALAALVVELPSVNTVRVVPGLQNDDTESLEIETTSAAELYKTLPELISDSGIKIVEMQAADESLKHLFSTLMRIHRGEAQGGGLA